MISPLGWLLDSHTDKTVERKGWLSIKLSHQTLAWIEETYHYYRCRRDLYYWCAKVAWGIILGSACFDYTIGLCHWFELKLSNDRTYQMRTNINVPTIFSHYLKSLPSGGTCIHPRLRTLFTHLESPSTQGNSSLCCLWFVLIPFALQD